MKKFAEIYNYKSKDVWAASCAAYRINKGYNPTAGINNKSLMLDLLKTPEKIIEDDYQLSDELVRYIKGWTFKLLTNKISSYEASLLSLTDLEEIKSNAAFLLGAIASAPNNYQRWKNDDDAQRAINNATGGYCGAVNSKVNFEITVLKCIFSIKYNIYFVTGINSEDQVVFFAYNSAIEPNKKVNIKGTVKAHKENSTQLNRVKII